MNSRYANVTKNQIENLIHSFISKNKHELVPNVDWVEIVQCILYTLKTGVQLGSLFVDSKWVICPFPDFDTFCAL